MDNIRLLNERGGATMLGSPPEGLSKAPKALERLSDLDNLKLAVGVFGDREVIQLGPAGGLM